MAKETAWWCRPAMLTEPDVEADLVASMALDGDRRHLLEELDPDLFFTAATTVRALAAAHKAGHLHVTLDDAGQPVWSGVDEWVSLRLRAAKAGVIVDVAAAIGRLQEAARLRELVEPLERIRQAMLERDAPAPEDLERIRDLLEVR